MDENVKIECPKCHWEPDGFSHWSCTCGTVWNTFATAGQCPSCGRQWEYTQCVDAHFGGCSQLSPHLDWYNNLDSWLEEELDEIKAPIKIA